MQALIFIGFAKSSTHIQFYEHNLVFMRHTRLNFSSYFDAQYWKKIQHEDFQFEVMNRQSCKLDVSGRPSLQIQSGHHSG